MILRRKIRYILVECSIDLDKDIKDINNFIRKEFLDILGEKEFTKTNPKVVHIVNNKSVVLRVNRGTEGDAALALSFIKRYNSSPSGFYTIKTSGTIKTIIESANA